MKALVLGGADCVWSDAAAALDLTEFDIAVGCNDIGAYWPAPLDAWVSLHPEKFKLWKARRGDRPPHKALYAIPGTPADCGATRYTQSMFPSQGHAGSSGLYALKVALMDLGCSRAVLCGVPMSPERRHFFETKEWHAAANHRKGWNEAMPHIAGHARSMSGWTAQLLGYPTAEWLETD